MFRLTRYLTTLFFGQALALLAIAVVLVWITQTLRLFELVTAKGQDMLTVAGQSILTTPPLIRAILFLCFAVGLVRALRALQTSRELHIIHAGRRVGTLWAALLIYVAGGALAVSLIAHWIEPRAQQVYEDWSEEIAADLVGRALAPNRFTEAVPGMVVSISGRRSDGTVTGFFAHDTRLKGTLRTYQADTALIVFDEGGYELSLRNGSVQYRKGNGEFTEVEFNRYEIGLDRLASASGTAGYSALDTLTLMQLQDQGSDGAAIDNILGERWAEISHVAGICLLVAGLAGFPKARRSRFQLPLEIIVVILCLVDRVISTSLANSLPAGHSTVSLVFALAGLLLIAWRYRYAPSLMMSRRAA